MHNHRELEGLVAAFGSPLYVYDLEEVERRAAELFGLLPAGSTLLFSLKANPLPAIAEQLRRSGCGAEVSSTGELRVALEAGFDPEQIFYTGPGKTDEEIRVALAAGVRHLSVESWTDLGRVEDAAEASATTVDILLRVNPSTPPQAKLVMTGIASQFGFEEEDLHAGADRLAALSPRVRVRGVHVYFGTQVGGCEALAATTRNAIQVAENLSEALGLTFDLLDVGGGFAWPYASPGVGPDLGGLRTALAELSAGRRRTASARLCFESGRYLCASSGTLVATVMDVKPSKGKQYVVLDTGIHHLGGMSGLGRIPRPIVLLQADGAGDPEPLEEADVVGPLCSPLDCVARNARMPRLKVGDLVRVPNVGAYGLTASLYGFLSRPAPVEVALRRGEVVGAYHLQGGHRRVACEPTRAGASGADGLR